MAGREVWHPIDAAPRPDLSRQARAESTIRHSPLEPDAFYIRVDGISGYRVQPENMRGGR